MNIPQILEIIRAGAEWTLRGSTLADLEWIDTVQVKPTQAELDAGQLQVDDLAYRDLRKDAYPPIGDQLDAFWKGGQDEIDMKVIIDAVKTQYPKP